MLHRISFHCSSLIVRSTSTNATAIPTKTSDASSINFNQQRKLRRTGNKNIVFVDGVRTPFLISSTNYKGMLPHQLSCQTLLALRNKLKLDMKTQPVDCISVGTVMQEVKTSNIAREAAITAGFPTSIPCHTVTQACISSNQAIASCVGHINSGVADSCIAGGVEYMSDAPIRFSRKMRALMLQLAKAKKPAAKVSVVLGMLNPSVWPPELPGITEFTTGESMGFSGDRLASAFRISRDEQDEYSLRSHTLAKKALDAGHLTDVFPVKPPNSAYVVADNGIRPSSLEAMRKLKASFVKPHGTITAANATFLTDGASACLLATEEKAKEFGWKPKLYLRDYIFVGTDPNDQLLIGPAYAVPKLLMRNGLTMQDIDVFEIHEAFAGQTLAVLKALDCDYFCREHVKLPSGKAFGAPPMEKVNTWGGSLSLGHPFSATGVRLVTMTANRLLKSGGQLGLITACAGGGLANAMLVEAYS